MTNEAFIKAVANDKAQVKLTSEKSYADKVTAMQAAGTPISADQQKIDLEVINKRVACLDSFHGKYSIPAAQLFRFLFERQQADIITLNKLCTGLMADLGQSIPDKDAEVSASGKVSSISLKAVQKASKVKGTEALGYYLFMQDYNKFHAKWKINFAELPDLDKILNPDTDKE